MEEKKQKQEKLSYEQLQKLAGDLGQQNQQLVQRLQQMQQVLENRDFDYTSFFVSMLFKVMDHPEMYSDNFVAWASGHIESILTSFAKESGTPQENANATE